MRIGIIGVGIAGRARARAISEREDACLVGVHRGRFAADTNAPMMEADDLLDACDMVVVSSPTPTHGAWVRQALTRGRSVVVEYPLSTEVDEAEELFGLARHMGCVLHVEHIELLSPTTEWMAAGGPWERMAMTFESHREPDTAAGLAMLQVSRVHRLVSVLGPVVTTHVTEAEPHRIRCSLVFANGLEVPCEFRCGGSRQLLWDGWTHRHHRRVRGPVALQDGEEVVLPARSLFAADLEVALQRVKGNAGAAYVSDARILAVLRTCATLGSVGSTSVVGMGG